MGLFSTILQFLSRYCVYIMIAFDKNYYQKHRDRFFTDPAGMNYTRKQWFVYLFVSHAAKTKTISLEPREVNAMPEFIPGLQLNEAFYWQAVRPILDRHFPALPHSAALIGSGSDVTGFDTAVSRDHEWGPRLNLFLAPNDFEATRPAVHEALRQELPVQFMGYSTHFSRPDPGDGGVRVREEIAHGPVEHHIYCYNCNKFISIRIGF